ncbi:sensor histidine kinase [Planobispora takensis]|uniref:Histidine kinase n=1 Tax=Planobispora takensis TaxID=1367882 RepID=A0A8J3T702_9ACTN|nr:histidine kinase [Planobispora takensis]GII05355.1 histidine kinase [Planobispora takensis]
MIRLSQWRRRGQAERFDLWARASSYTMFAFEPVALAVVVGPEVAAAALGVMTAGAAVHALVCALLVSAGLERYLGREHRGRGSRPTGLITVAAGLTVAQVAIGALAYPEATPGHPDGPASALLVVTVVAFVTALSSAVPYPLTLAMIVSAGLARWVVSRVEGAPAQAAVPAAIALSVLLLVVVIAFRSSMWTLRVVWELDRARKAQARLAVAEERLRFARDLHDVMGRNLSVVALKSELAAQLVKRGKPGAAEEMLQVRRLAQDSLTEARALVRGYRTADLEAELAGARSVLASAGIGCEVIGDGYGLPADVQGALGWVVREGVTNVLRHSRARVCTVSLHHTSEAGTGRLTLIMENDGATGPDGERPAGTGTGIPGLTERLAARGGRLVAAYERPDRFRLTAELPLPALAHEDLR